MALLVWFMTGIALWRFTVFLPARNGPEPEAPLERLFIRDGADAWKTHYQASRARELGQDVILLSVGDPDLDTPAPVVERAIECLRSGDTHYTPATGREPLRTAIAEQHRVRSGQEVDARNELFHPASHSKTTLSRNRPNTELGSREGKNGRLQPKTSVKFRACSFPTRPLMREWVAGVGVTKLYSAPFRKEINSLSLLSDSRLPACCMVVNPFASLPFLSGTNQSQNGSERYDGAHQKS